MTNDQAEWLFWGVVIGVPFTIFYGRSASTVERAKLIERAQDSEHALCVAKAASGRRYLPIFLYQHAMEQVLTIVEHERAEAVLATAGIQVTRL